MTGRTSRLSVEAFAPRRRATALGALALFFGALAPAVGLAQPQPAPTPPPATPPPATPPATPTAPPSAPPATAPEAAPGQPAPVAAPPVEPLMPAPQPVAPAPTPAPSPAAAPPDVDKDKKALEAQAKERPTGGGDVGAKPSDVYAEDWWTQVRPSFEIHGYYRLRAELFYNFTLGRTDDPGTELWPQPPANSYRTLQTNQNIKLCGDDPLKRENCEAKTQAGANMRFRINPELHVSDNIRVLAQVDLLDNLVLGSTPDGYANQPALSGGYSTVARGGYSPLGAFATTQWTPTAGYNSTRNSISVKRVWGEYMTPLGLLRFGRMPSHWGLGMLANSGDGYDSDYASTADRIMFVTGIKKLDLYFAGAWDFPNEGAINERLNEAQGQPYDRTQLDDVSQYALIAVRRRDPQLQRLDLARGDVVVNGGAYFVFRNQTLAADESGSGAAINASSSDVSATYVRRGASAYIPDLWVQFLYKKFRFEAEGTMIIGSIENTKRAPNTTDYVNSADPNNDGWKLRQFGFATQSEFRAIEDKLRIQFGFGWASGDPDVASIAPQGEGLQPQLTADRTFSTFRFHPDYRVDLILFRNILTRVQGAYYFKPQVSYDFVRDKSGQRLGGDAALIWSRASEFVQAPGHKRDLGVELDFSLYYQAKDGSLNDDPNKMGGFYTMAQYGVLFPLGGLGYLPGQVQDFRAAGLTEPDTSAAHIVRWYMGILY